MNKGFSGVRKESFSREGCCYTEGNNSWRLVHYVNGVKEGVEEGYLDGMLYYQTPYVNGKRHGVSIYYHAITGKLNMRVPYVNDKKQGVAKYFDGKSGRLEQEITYEKGKKKCEVNYYENGNIESVVEYSGKVLRKIPYAEYEIHGDLKKYFESGELAEVIPYKNGKIDGVCIEYDARGKVKSKTQYKDGKKVKLEKAS